MTDTSPRAVNGRIDLATTYLGREVATPEQVLQVIRPQMRMARCLYRGILDAALEGWLDANEDLELNDGGDNAAWDKAHMGLIEDAELNVRQWANDMAVVFDKDRLREFVRIALSDAMTAKGGEETLPGIGLDY